MGDDKLAIEEARRAAQHESVKSQVEGEVNAEISDRAATKATHDESRRIDQVTNNSPPNLLSSWAALCFSGLWRPP